MSAASLSIHDRSARRADRGARGVVLGSVVLILALTWLIAASSASALGPAGCDYADSGTGAYADTICWIDFSGFDNATARSAAGQPMSISLPGGYTATFAVKVRPVAGFVDISTCIADEAVPFWTYPLGPPYTTWPLGALEYKNITGRPGLLNTNGVPPGGTFPPSCYPPNAAANLIVDNIVVTDAAGQPVSGYGIVSTESEASVNPEGIIWNSDSTLSLFDTIDPPGTSGGCIGSQVTGYGTTTVTCTGKAPAIGGYYGTSLILAQSPTFFSTTSVRPSGILGTAYGFVTSKVRLNKVADALYAPSDAFGLEARSGATVLGSGSTNGGLTGSTGEVTVLAGGSFDLVESPAAGTDLANYKQSWTCNRNGVNDPSLSSSGNTTKTVTPAIGDFIDCTVTNTLKRADVSIVKSADPSPAVPGTNETYKLVVKNNGPDEARNVRVSDPLPGGLSFVSASPGCAAANKTVTCTTASLAAGASQTFTVTAKLASSVDSCADLRNTASVTSLTIDPNSSNNSSTVCPPLQPRVDLSMTKKPSRTQVPTGGQVMYTLVVKNNGPSDASGVTVTDPMAAGLSLVSAKPSQGTCSTTGGHVSCNVGQLDAGGSAQVLVTAQVTATSGCITNTSTASTDDTDTDAANNKGSATICVPPTPPSPATQFDLVVAKKVDDKSVYVGEPINYTVTVTNKGPDAAPNAKVTDTLNHPASVVSVKSTQGNCTKSIPMTCQLGNIPVGAKVTITVTVKLRESGCKQRNAASATGEGADTNPANNMATVDVCAKAVPLRLTKVADSGSVRAGSTVGYTIRVSNPTAGEAKDVKVCDKLPSGLVYVSSKAKAKFSAGQYCWTIKTLAAHDSESFRITVRALGSASGDRVNRATASAKGAKTRHAKDPVRVLGARASGGGVTG
jgi:uncharacterized repeat protein (TIGR01451 family)